MEDYVNNYSVKKEVHRITKENEELFEYTKEIEDILTIGLLVENNIEYYDYENKWVYKDYEYVKLLSKKVSDLVRKLLTEYSFRKYSIVSFEEYLKMDTKGKGYMEDKIISSTAEDFCEVVFKNFSYTFTLLLRIKDYFKNGILYGSL